jgi:acetyl-CoA carboxylase/biotin carboxylase 1
MKYSLFTYIGVSHVAVNNDLDGVVAMLRWISYVPKTVHDPLPIVLPADSWDRDVEFHPPRNEPYDPRYLIEGCQDPDTGRYLRGLFGKYILTIGNEQILDSGSFMETLDQWAKTVVTGRARLGGIPIGIIAVETRSISHTVLADPANPESREQTLMQPGQVWFPDSAFKTAQAIRDFNNGERLPLMILANWRVRI